MPLLRVPIGVDGPVIELDIWISRVAAHALIAQGQAVPPSQTLRALIDTGADRTAIHPNALALINSPPAGTIRVRRPGSTTAFRRVNLHDVRLAFAGVLALPSRTVWVEVEAAAVIPADPKILALIGRDMLAHCQFIYDGPDSELLLVY
jgi:predicted aspartyl protease